MWEAMTAAGEMHFLALSFLTTAAVVDTTDDLVSGSESLAEPRTVLRGLSGDVDVVGRILRARA